MSAQQYATFMLAESEYALEIESVQEFKVFGAVTRVPNMPHYLRGVMNLRGVIVPVFDLRLRFGLPAPCSETTVVVVVRVEARTVGLVVDAVSDVVEIAPEEIQAAAELGSQVAAAQLRGIARVKERLVMLLELERVVRH